MKIISTIAMLFLALPLQAQTVRKRFEVSPSIGYLFGGAVYDFNLVHPPIANLPPPPNIRVDVADHLSYGLRLGYYAGDQLEPEFQWSHVETVLRSSKSTLSQYPDLPLQLDYLLAGITYNLKRGGTRPYVSLSAGAVRLSPTFSGDLAKPKAGSEMRFTGALAVGLKTFVTPSVGLRVEAKGYASRIANIRFGLICTTFSTLDPGSVPINRPCPTKDWLWNGELSSGVVLAF